METVLIGAIMNGVSSISQIFAAREQRKIVKEQGKVSQVPTYEDIFLNYRTDGSRTRLFIIIGLISAIIVIVLAFTFTKKSRS